MAETAKLEELNKSMDAEPLHIDTFDGMNEPLHPSVLYFDTAWNGYTFWMAYTPYPVSLAPRRDRWECPAIACSVNGRDWILPPNAPNPLVDLTEAEIARGDFFSDTALVMNGNRMEVWYRQTYGNNRETDIFRVTSINGSTWTSPEKVIDYTEANNGFGANQSMRSHQVFYDGTKYTAFFGLQNGLNGTVWRAESTDPSSRVWSGLRQVNINAPFSFRIWHLGMYLHGGIYHMTAYDAENNAIQYLTSSDGINFDYVDVILKGDDNTITRNYYGLYQTVPVKVKNEWLVYSSGYFRVNNNSRTGGSPTFGSKVGIALFSGEKLTGISPVEGGTINKRSRFNVSPVLNNNLGDNSVTQKYWGTFFSVNPDRFSGYKMNFGLNDHAPAWFDKVRTRPITFVFESGSNPNLAPEHIGMIWRKIDNKKLWISAGTDSVNDWKPLAVFDSAGTVIHTQSKDVSSESAVDVTGAYRLCIKSVGATNEILNLNGGVDGQELILLNLTIEKVPLTIKHSILPGTRMRLRGKVDRALQFNETISLINVSGSWFEI